MKICWKYKGIWSKIKYLIELKNNNSDEYGEKYIKIRFNSDNDLLLRKILKTCNAVILIRSVFKDMKKYYYQVFLEACLYKSKIHIFCILE